MTQPLYCHIWLSLLQSCYSWYYNETCESFFSETHHQTLQVSVAIFHGICMIVFAYEYDEVYRANFFSNTNLFGIRGRGCRSWPQNATISFPKTSVLKFSGGGCPRSPAGNRTWWYVSRVPFTENVYIHSRAWAFYVQLLFFDPFSRRIIYSPYHKEKAREDGG